MVQDPFDYHDYHRTVVAFHGTTETVADDLVAGGDFTLSVNPYDWLGTGIYFWEYAPKQAWWWATRFKKKSKPAVVGAMIRLGNCFDLLDPVNVQLLTGMYEVMMNKWEEEGTEPPSNVRQRKNLDCAVFNYCYDDAIAQGNPIDSARAVYVPLTKPRGFGKGAGSMKKRTSKSASATRRTSSRSGTSGPTVDTVREAVDRAMPSPVARTLEKTIEKVKNMTPEEFRQSLFRAGITNEDGTLRPEYKRRR